MGSTPRPLPSGGSVLRLRTRRPGRHRSPPFFPCNRKPLSLLFGGIRCCHSTTVFMPCRLRSRNCPVRRCTDACSGRRSPGCPTSMAPGPGARCSRSNPIGYVHIDIAEVHNYSAGSAIWSLRESSNVTSTRLRGICFILISNGLHALRDSRTGSPKTVATRFPGPVPSASPSRSTTTAASPSPPCFGRNPLFGAPLPANRPRLLRAHGHPLSRPCSPTMASATARTPSPMPATPSASSTAAPAPTPREPTAKRNRFIQTALREWAYARTYQNSAERE